MRAQIRIVAGHRDAPARMVAGGVLPRGPERCTEARSLDRSPARRRGHVRRTSHMAQRGPAGHVPLARKRKLQSRLRLEPVATVESRTSMVMSPVPSWRWPPPMPTERLPSTWMSPFRAAMSMSPLLSCMKDIPPESALSSRCRRAVHRRKCHLLHPGTRPRCHQNTSLTTRFRACGRCRGRWRCQCHREVIGEVDGEIALARFAGAVHDVAVRGGIVGRGRADDRRPGFGLAAFVLGPRRVGDPERDGQADDGDAEWKPGAQASRVIPTTRIADTRSDRQSCKFFHETISK